MCDNCGWDDTLDTLDDMITESSQFQWAFPTLDGIYTWIKREKHVTPAQRRAIKNIENAHKAQIPRDP